MIFTFLSKNSVITHNSRIIVNSRPEQNKLRLEKYPQDIPNIIKIITRNAGYEAEGNRYLTEPLITVRNRKVYFLTDLQKLFKYLL